MGAHPVIACRSPPGSDGPFPRVVGARRNTPPSVPVRNIVEARQHRVLRAVVLLRVRRGWILRAKLPARVFQRPIQQLEMQHLLLAHLELDPVSLAHHPRAIKPRRDEWPRCIDEHTVPVLRACGHRTLVEAITAPHQDLPVHYVLAIHVLTLQNVVSGAKIGEPTPRFSFDLYRNGLIPVLHPFAVDFLS